MSKPFIRKVPTASGATAVQVVRKSGSAIIRIDHIGSAHDELELEILLVKAQELIDYENPRIDLFSSKKPRGFAEKSYSELLWLALASEYSALGFDVLDDEVFKQIVLARIIEPTSKLDTIRVLRNLGLKTPSNSGIHRSLRRSIDQDFRSASAACCFKQATEHSLSLLLYDVTTLYFEVQKENDYKKSGMSKERRLDPQITVGLLVGRDGFPLEVRSFEGNKAEVKTIMEVLYTFKERYGLTDLTVTADAAMLSSKNIQALEDSGYHYIIGSRIAKTPYEIREYAKEPGAKLADGQTFDTLQEMNTGKGEKRIKRRVIYQYREKRARLDLANIDKLLAKAEKMVSGKAEFKRNRFLKVSGSKREINYGLVEASRLRAGIKGYVTDLDSPAAEIINAYHQLFEVERSFRMAKSDLAARPIFHRERDSIEAHLTTVFCALAISRRIQAKTGMTIRRFLELLEPLKTVILNLNGSRYEFKPDIDEKTAQVLSLLDARIW